jgi:sugar O-acyltransferase (sialic acid O-acetyltransferase NeuD family)
MNFIFGSAGFAKEVDWLIQELPIQQSSKYKSDYFVSQDQIGTMLNGKEIIDEAQFFEIIKDEKLHNIFIGIGSPAIRRKIVSKMAGFDQLTYPNLIHPSVLFDRREHKLLIGKGNIICAGTILTTDITMGSFIHLNLGVTIGHDTKIGDYCTASPGCHISGKVTIGSDVFLGTGAVILENLPICDTAIIGAGAVVNKPIKEPGTYVGIPAKQVVRQ